MRPGQVSDASGADFGAGETDAGAYVTRTACGGVMLAPSVVAEFTGAEMPAGWTVTPYAEGGTGVIGHGRLSLDGARVGSDVVFRGPPRVLDFRATFAARPDQLAGFGIDYVQAPWVTFSTKWGRRLYARTHHVLLEDKRLPGSWLGETHDFRIEWNLLDINFDIDGERVAHLLVPVPGYARAVVANQRVGGPPLEVEWVRVSPYAATGTFTSRVLDAGSGAGVEWTEATWTATVPEGTALDLSVRTGEDGRAGREWSQWRPLPGPGATVGGASRYLQYRVAMATDDVGRTPVLREIAFGHRDHPEG
ncbi:MAG: hypothetical protein M3066_10205 [Actinomycetota bacterium]|nr:hypothetical protein [Actinomycetota bacterium]